MASKRKDKATPPGPASWECEVENWEEYTSDEGGEVSSDGDSTDVDAYYTQQFSTAEAQEELVNFLLERHWKGKMTAKDVCLVAWWCGQAGLSEVGALGLSPTSNTGNYRRHLDAYLKQQEGETPGTQLYTVPMPAFVRASGDRAVHNLQTRPAHEAVAQEMEAIDVHKALQSPSFEAPPNFAQHPVARALQESRKAVIPVAVYMDAVQYAKRDSMVVLTLTNLLTGKKHLLATLRKRVMCGQKAGCGCRGWCSLYPLWLWLRWSLEALAKGKWPNGRHNCELDDNLLPGGWRPEDSARSAKAGQDLPCAAACVQIRADWAEMSTRLGAASWSTSSDPCFLCRCSKEHMLDLEQLQQRDPPGWPLRTPAEHDSVCSACEVEVETGELSTQKFSELRAALHMDLRKDGSQGLRLTKAFPELGLRVGDRVEPSEHLLDWKGILEGQPATVMFWRRKCETAMRHRNPLLDPKLGTTLVQCFGIDTMHTLCLGIYQEFTVSVLWKALLSPIFASAEPWQSRNVSIEQRASRAMVKLSKDLKDWYRSFEAENPNIVITRVHDLNVESLGGTESKKQLRAKAHESLGLLRYVTSQLPVWQEHLEQGPLWRQASEALMGLWQGMEHAPVKVAPDMQQVGR